MTSLLLLKSMLFASVLQKNKKKKKLRMKKPIPPSVIDLKLCRVCNLGKGEIPIFDNLTQPNISDEIRNFSGVIINKTDNLPKHLCKNCLDLLNGCIVFRDMCQTNNKVLIELSIKRETSFDESTQDSEDSYNIPSPNFSEDNSEIWGCTTCNKEFFDRASYDTHFNSCNKTTSDEQKEPEDSNKKTFLCDICGKTARSNANLLVHMGIHENVFPYKCDQCPYQGRTMDLLKVHKRTHMANKPFKCSLCPKTTTTSSNLAKHMRHVHSTTRPYKCTYCDKAFSYQHDMKRHIRDIHLRQGTVECDVCYKKFNTKKILQGHRWKIHKIKGERHGRLPSYLQCQLDDDNDNNTNESEPTY
ncbi:zinc finger protein 681-like [Nymphalis io]|uniref:zinc finger protein 681-like n=1 Tax=Inachis io TaxID=171585 RepID=UPI002169BFD4|nr:zinc finger protein 681-like [Nymphalis io]